MSGKGLKAIVAGAGIGGLTAGLALRRAGAEVTLIERAASMSEIQAGIDMVLWPNGMRALDTLGLSQGAERIGAPIERLDLCAHPGEILNRWGIGDVGRRVGAPALALSRGELHAVLAEAFESESAVELGTRLVDFDEDEDGVTVSFEDGRSERADVLIGADGIASGIRRKLTGRGPPDYPPYAGYTIWHSIVPFEGDAVPGGIFFLLFGRGARFAHYRLDDERVYWSGIGDIYGGESLAEWGAGRVTLLGDAAHPMTTNLGQGAGMAIEDGVVLAGCLERSSGPQAGLRDYEVRRIPRTNTMMELANRLNSDASLERRVRTWVRNQMIKHLFDRGIGRGYTAFIEEDALAAGRGA